jgi:histidinol-phosphate/aromatic aminotransferase/cobyric acid decarboxylase-like protein
VKFPLADWIDEHEDCRFNLALSGMRGSVRHPLPTPRAVRTASQEELEQELARTLGVDPRRVFLTAGATQGNTSVLYFLAGRHVRPNGLCRIRYPEYPPLFDTARWAGFRPTVSSRPTAIAIVSQPRNPEGILWTRSELRRWAAGARDLVVDETFREFSERPSVAADDRLGCWVTGSFTKYFGADDLRVGFVVAPEVEVEAYGRFHGLVHDQLPAHSVAGALACLRSLGTIRREVNRVVHRNLAVLRSAFPRSPLPVAPVFFDRLPGASGDLLARRCLSASVLVCPGTFFGEAAGVRICLTRRSFPRDLAAYLRVRKEFAPSRLKESPVPARTAGVRPRRAGIARG